MVMSVVQRFNLTFNPYSPVMPAEGDLFYRSPTNPNLLRRAILSALSDVQISNTLPAAPGNLAPAVIVNGTGAGYYVASGSAMPTQFSETNLQTGATNVRNYVDTMRIVPARWDPDTYVVSNTSAFPAFEDLWTCKPPNVPTKFDNVTSQVDAPRETAWREAHYESGQRYKLRGFPYPDGGPYTGNALRAISGAGGFGEWRFPYSDGGNQLIPFELNGQIPHFFVPTIGAVSFQEMAGFCRQNATNRIFYVIGRRTGAIPASYILDTGRTVGAASSRHDAIACAQDFYRIYFSLRDNTANVAFRLHGCGVRSFNFNEFIDLDATNANSITGLWVYPPFIYVAKSQGGTYTAQLIKVHDSELERKGGGRRGGELWSIAPEIGKYLP